MKLCGAYAAIKLPANSVGTTQLKRKAVTPRKLSASTLRLIASKGTPGPKGDTGPQGPKGDSGPQGNSGTNGVSGEPATKLWAIVYADGTIERASGAIAASKPYTGVYQVRFNQDVSQCSYQVTVGNGSAFWFGFTNSPAFAMAKPAAVPNGGPTIPLPDTVRVGTYDQSGSVLDVDFHLAVFC
jgi:hypothetical protein